MSKTMMWDRLEDLNWFIDKNNYEEGLTEEYLINYHNENGCYPTIDQLKNERDAMKRWLYPNKERYEKLRIIVRQITKIGYQDFLETM